MTIKERAIEYADRLKSAEISDFGVATVYSYKDVYNANMAAYKRGATEQKTIDIEKACNIFCHVGCPHKTDSYDCLKDKCDAWKRFRRMMEE